MYYNELKCWCSLEEMQKDFKDIVEGPDFDAPYARMFPIGEIHSVYREFKDRKVYQINGCAVIKGSAPRGWHVLYRPTEIAFLRKMYHWEFKFNPDYEAFWKWYLNYIKDYE